jgi:hypothetical protein
VAGPTESRTLTERALLCYPRLHPQSKSLPRRVQFG